MSNFLINNLITIINLGAKRKLRFIKINLNDLNLNIIKLLYSHGAIRTYLIKNNKILLYFKFNLRKMIIKLTIISKPSNRIYLNIKNLANLYNKNNFSGFYIISTHKGLITSNSSLLKEHLGGELLIKVEI
jgi:ribosomal protein S8